LIRPLKLIFAANVALLATSAVAQNTKLQQQLSHVDLGIQAVGQFNKAVSGPVVATANNTGSILSQDASNTVGGLVTIRYTPKPYLGVEFNGGYARYTENFGVVSGSTPPAAFNGIQIQTQANEFTVGYLVTPPYTIFGVKPFASAGAGSIRFAPTRGGGQNAPTQARAAYYYNLGVQKDVLGSYFGLRAGFRQVFFLAPDFLENYLTIKQHTSTVEPMIGFYLRF
jgi:hypothetical protein